MSSAEDILSSSLESLYGFQAVSFSSPGSLFTFKHSGALEVTLRTPDTAAANWNLHASDIWIASVFLARHLEELHLDRYTAPIRVLELGAGAGLPGIAIAKAYQSALVTVSDYPDDTLIQTLFENIVRNDVIDRCRALPFCWGSYPASLFSDLPGGHDDPGFDVVIAADTLWNSETHEILLKTLIATLRRTSKARIHLVAGFHTGRFTLQGFINTVNGDDCPLEIELVEERHITQDRRRSWDIAYAEDEDEAERRRWILWIVLRWSA